MKYLVVGISRTESQPTVLSFRYQPSGVNRLEVFEKRFDDSTPVTISLGDMININDNGIFWIPRGGQETQLAVT